jgi:tetratricopeptide (TPR) repeat protein
MPDRRGSARTARPGGRPIKPPRVKEGGDTRAARYRGRTDDRDRKRKEKPAPKHPPVHISDEVVKELHNAARPGKGEILVQVFSEAMAAFAQGDFQEAIELGEQAKHIALRSVNAREFLGLAYYNADRWREAARELSAFRRISGSNDQNPVIADCYRATGKPDKALEWADQVDPRQSPPEVYYEAAIVGAGALSDMGRVDEAIARLETLQLEPRVAEEHHLRAWYVLGDLLEKKGRFTQARKWFESIAAVDPEMTDAPERAARIK